MSIETLLPPEKTPASVKLFHRWMEQYVLEHGLMNGCAPKVYLRDHYPTWRDKADELGLILGEDGSLIERTRQ